MSFDTRNNSALMKRAEQVRRWEESDTNLEPSGPKNEKGRKIKFSSGCVFLAACVAGDKDEVRRLLDTGADINTANVDGLTALHQACIDDNLEMVEFLVEHGADINRQDNEGWTPLHATSSCGFVSIARYLVENGADLTAINSDGELAIDLASTNAMADYLQGLIEEYGIDCEKARQQEEQLMLNDAKKWLRSDASEADKPHPKTGATALHVAAAKGYTKVLSLLLAGRANVDKQDNDGWTPLHAAAHWGQKEAAEMLVDALADMDVRNYAGQTAIDVADKKILKFLEELKANNKRAKRRPSSQIRISDTIENHIETPTKLIRVEVKSDTKEQSNEQTSKPPSEPANAVPPDSGDEDAPWRRSSMRNRNQTESPPKTQVPEKEAKPSDSEVILRRTQSFENDEKFYQKYNELRARIKANSCPILPATQSAGVLGAVNTPNSYSVQRSASLKDHRHLRKPVSPPVSPSVPTATPNTTQVRRSFVPPVRDEESETQRKAHAKRVRETRRSTQGVTLDEIKSAEELVKKKNLNNNNNDSSNDTQNTSSSTTVTTNTPITPIMKITVNDRILPTIISTSDDIVNDTTQSHQPCEEITASYTITAPISSKLRETSGDEYSSSSSSKISATYTMTPPITTIIPSISIADRADENLEKVKEDIVTTVNVPNSSNKTEDLEELTRTASPTIVIGAFVDEMIHPSPQKQTEILTNTELLESPEIREKRSLFDIDNANSLTLAEKLRNEANKYSETTQSNNEIITTEDVDKESVSRKSDSAPSSPLHQNTTERRPSWRLKFDSGSKFKLEDASTGANFPANNSTIITSAPAVIAAANLSSAAQKRNSSTNTSTTAPKPSSTSDGTENSTENLRDSTSEVTVTLRRNKTSEDKENDKENDGRNVQAAQSVIQRRRKPKRRSTGVVHLDMDEIDPEKQDSPGDNEEKESGGEKTSRSRVSSTASLADNEQGESKNSSKETENGEVIDYKALWEAAKLENDKLKKELKKKDDELTNAKVVVDRFTNATTKNSLSELEKRERRAMERKLSEMEEELKHLDILKSENQRLKEENGALIRVISKLSK